VLEKSRSKDARHAAFKPIVSADRFLILRSSPLEIPDDDFASQGETARYKLSSGL